MRMPKKDRICLGDRSGSKWVQSTDLKREIRILSIRQIHNRKTVPKD